MNPKPRSIQEILDDSKIVSFIFKPNPIKIGEKGMFYFEYADLEKNLSEAENIVIDLIYKKNYRTIRAPYVIFSKQEIKECRQKNGMFLKAVQTGNTKFFRDYINDIGRLQIVFSIKIKMGSFIYESKTRVVFLGES